MAVVHHGFGRVHQPHGIVAGGAGVGRLHHRLLGKQLAGRLVVIETLNRMLPGRWVDDLHGVIMGTLLQPGCLLLLLISEEGKEIILEKLSLISAMGIPKSN